MKQKIIEIIKHNVPMIIAVAIILSGMLLIVSFRGDSPLGGRSGGDSGELLTVATSNLDNTWTNYPAFSGSATLNKIVIGQTGGGVAVYDTISSPGPASIIFFATGSSVQVFELDLKIDSGLMINATAQDYVTFYYTPD